MRWLLLPFRFCLYFPFYALFGSLRWLTHNFDRFVNIGAKLIGITFVMWFLALASGAKIRVTLPPEVPFLWWVVILICFWCALGWVLSTRPFQWVFGGIADYCKAAIFPPPPAPRAPKPKKAPPPPAPPKVHIAAVASKGVAGGASIEDAVGQVSPDLLRLMTPPAEPHP